MANLLSRENGGHSLARPFEDFWTDPFRSFVPSMSQFSGMDVTRTESGYTVEIPVAGFKPDQIEVTLENSVVTINGKTEKRQFTRSIVVPEDIDAEKIEANVEHGMLTLQLPLQPKAQPKKISIKTN